MQQDMNSLPLECSDSRTAEFSAGQKPRRAPWPHAVEPATHPGTESGFVKEWSLCSDEELVIAAQDGVSCALDELFKRHRALVCRTARRLSGTAEEAEDLVQETMLRALRSIGGFRKEARFSSWLVAIVTNAAISIKRKEGRVRWLFLDEPVNTDESPIAVDLPDTRRNPEQEYLQKELCVFVQHAVSRQKPKVQVILRACELHELSFEEAAHQLGITQAAAKSRLFRARRQLSRTLRKTSRTVLWP